MIAVATPLPGTLMQHDLFQVDPELPAWARRIPEEWPRLVDPPPVPLSELIPPEEV